MTRIGVAVALAALIVVPSAFAGPSTGADRARAVSDCETLRPAMNRTVGAGTFGKAFGTARVARADAFRNCVRAFTVEVHENRHAVVAACEESTTTRRAFGECVADGMRAASREDRRDWVNAAETCKAEREDAAAFATAYGEGRNAYGTCVSTHAKAQNDEEPAG